MSPSRSPKAPLLTFELQPPKPKLSYDDSSSIWAENDVPSGKRRKSWISYIPTFVALAFIIAPQPPLLVVLTRYYLVHLKSTKLFLAHLLINLGLTFVALTCFLVVVVRDPGPVDASKAQAVENATITANQPELPPTEEGEELSLTDALMGPSPNKGDENWTGNGDRRWCQACWAPKPERCHHCSECGRCVLKMDHHCPWVGAKCIGFRTYGTFVHLLGSITLLCVHTFFVILPAIRYYMDISISELDWTPYLAIGVALLSFVFSLTIGSFWGYHVYLVSTNQTTLEHLAPFLLLRHLPPPSAPISSPPSSSGYSTPDHNRPSESEDPDSPYFFPPPSPPQAPPPERLKEHQLNFKQRRRVRYAHGKIGIYDLGFQRNWGEVFGGGIKKGRRWLWWLRLILIGGGSRGDGYTFEFNNKAKRQLKRLANELEGMAS